jgi:hypothetical protein
VVLICNTRELFFSPCKAQFRDLNLSKSLVSLQAISCPATAMYCRSLVRLLSLNQVLGVSWLWDEF